MMEVASVPVKDAIRICIDELNDLPVAVKMDMTRDGIKHVIMILQAILDAIEKDEQARQAGHGEEAAEE